MTGIERKFPDLPDWTFEIDEISAGVYQVRGFDAEGRRVETTGTDPHALLDECRGAAARMRGGTAGDGSA
jgi:hypothetical protein